MFKYRIEKLRMDRGWSLSDLAKESGVSYNTLWRMEKYDGSVSTKTLEKIALALDAPVPLLLEDEKFILMETIFDHVPSSIIEFMYDYRNHEEILLLINKKNSGT